jgi:hypothetical protein
MRPLTAGLRDAAPARREPLTGCADRPLLDEVSDTCRVPVKSPPVALGGVMTATLPA